MRSVGIFSFPPFSPATTISRRDRPGFDRLVFSPPSLLVPRNMQPIFLFFPLLPHSDGFPSGLLEKDFPFPFRRCYGSRRPPGPCEFPLSPFLLKNGLSGLFFCLPPSEEAGEIFFRELSFPFSMKRLSVGKTFSFPPRRPFL